MVGGIAEGSRCAVGVDAFPAGRHRSGRGGGGGRGGAPDVEVLDIGQRVDGDTFRAEAEEHGRAGLVAAVGLDEKVVRGVALQAAEHQRVLRDGLVVAVFQVVGVERAGRAEGIEPGGLVAAGRPGDGRAVGRDAGGVDVLHMQTARNVIDVDVIHIHVGVRPFRDAEGDVAAAAGVSRGEELALFPRVGRRWGEAAEQLEGGEVRRVAHHTDFDVVAGRGLSGLERDLQAVHLHVVGETRGGGIAVVGRGSVEVERVRSADGLGTRHIRIAAAVVRAAAPAVHEAGV